ncbi:ATP-binding cassette domain-containing protein [uncultured Microbulbifer sp.]|uniref:ATP-binding cassette domain-containing protein n=1 Tax=uncultured Microbulbifer sp. TaxID=348147 RepID=UPI00344EF447
MAVVQTRTQSGTSSSSSIVSLNTLSIDISQGEFVSLPGPSGCGKSTALAACV